MEYQDFLSELHEWLPESCNSFGKMMSHILSSAQLNMIDELAGKVMNFISVALGSVLPEPVKEVLQNRAVQGIMKVTGGVTQITAGCGLCTTLAGAFAGVPMIILGANMAIEGIQDLWHVVKGDLDVQSKNLLKEATGHKVDNILDLAELVSTMGSAKAAGKMSSKTFAEAQSKLGKALNKARNKAREIETVVSEKARLLNRAARQFIRRECGTFRGPKRFAKPVDFGRLFKKHGAKTAPGPRLQPLSKAELEKVVGGAKDPNWRPGGTASCEKPKASDWKPSGDNVNRFGNYQFKEGVDFDLRGKGTVDDALEIAFKQLGESKEDFIVTKWAENKNQYGKSVPIEWISTKTQAEISIDAPHVNNTDAPQIPHVGYRTGGKRKQGGKIVGHIFIDEVDYYRPRK